MSRSSWGPWRHTSPETSFKNAVSPNDNLTPAQLRLSLDQVLRQACVRLMREPMPHAARIDLFHTLIVDDAPARMLNRVHRVRVRLSITVRSLLFDQPSSGSDGSGQ